MNEMTFSEQMFNDPLIDGHESQADFYDEIQAEADSGLPIDCCDFCGRQDNLFWTKCNAGYGYTCRPCLLEITSTPNNEITIIANA